MTRDRLRLVFAGTPDFAVPCLAACLASEHDVVAVYTQPDRPAGRGRQLAASPVKHEAIAAGVPVEQPESLKTIDARKRLAAYAPDLLVVVAYGLILPKSVLALPRLGCWNVHASLLPRWRGAAPIQRAILAGDRETGVCLMQMEAGLDTGPVLIAESIRMPANATGGSLHDTLSTLGAAVLNDALYRVARGEKLLATPQPSEGATYAHKLEKSEAALDWNDTALALERKVRAFDPWPVAEGDIAGERLRVWRATALTSRKPAIPGTLVGASRDGLDMATADGILRITELQRAGGRRIAAADYVNARPGLRGAP